MRFFIVILLSCFSYIIGFSANNVNASVSRKKENKAPLIKSFKIKRKQQGEQGVNQYIGRVNASDPDGDNLTYKFILIKGKGRIEKIDQKSFVYHEQREGKHIIKVIVTDSFGLSNSLIASIDIDAIDISKLYFDRNTWESYIGRNPGFARHKSFVFQENNPALPNVLIIGNSISIAYTPFVQENLKGVANVYRIPANGGDTNTMLKFHEIWLGNTKWDIIHFNWGLHDLKRLVDNKLNVSGNRNVSVGDYSKNLNSIVSILEKSSDKLIFATTSVVPFGAEGRVKGAEVLYNKAALKVLDLYPDVFIDDQYSLTLKNPEDQKEANVHFLMSGCMSQANQVSEKIIEVLKSNSSDNKTNIKK